MPATTSADGTTISYDIVGSGPAIVSVPGAFNLRDALAPLAAELASDHTVLTPDRRARGQSTDMRPYAVEREVEDLQALVELVGGSAAVFGYSSGAILALKAASVGVSVERLYLYEPPFRLDGTQPALPEDLPARLQALLDQGDPGAVVATFQTEAIGLPAQVVEGIRQSPMWPQLEQLAQSVVYDAIISTDLQRPDPAMEAVTVPTLVLQGDPTWPVLRTAAEELERRLPNANRTVLAVADAHGIDPAATAAAIRRFESDNR